ncbi:MAG: AAA family ATPase, partial [Oligoflexia bacterium]|nr:AAA family ATPase [Oligoflexia bacterium]
MRVSRIEIFGFKSFMEKVVIPLEGGVTGVVGPNGCGKSNVVDALRWVLGETKASNLRGDTLEDVIFNGTDKLRPLGLAEVTITLRSSEENFFADLVSPSAEADLIANLAALEVNTEDSEEAPAIEAESDKVDQQESKTEEAGARPGLTVIQGGLDESSDTIADLAQIDQSIDQSAETNEVTEAPAAVKAEERDDERKSPTFLTRFGWLKSVNEVQITRRLYRSGESEFFLNRVPCRLKDLKDFFRAVGLGARSHTIVAQGEVSRIVTAKPEERRLILEEAAGVLGFRDKIASATRRLEETGINISRIEDIIKEVDRQVSTLKRQAARAEAREELKTRIAELEEALFLDKTLELRQEEDRAHSSREGAQSAEAKAETELRAVEAREQESRSELMSVDVESDELRVKMNALSEEIYQRERQRSDRRARIAEIGAFVAARGTEMRRLEERLSTLAQRKSNAGAEIDVLAQREKALTGEITEFESHGEEELKQASDSLNEKREILRQREQELRSVREEYISKNSSLKATREQLVAASPVTQLKETLRTPNSKFLETLAAQSKLLVDGLIVPPEYSRAAQAVLAERAQFLVSDSPFEIAQQFLGEAYGAAQGNKKTRSGLGVLKAGEGQTDAALVAVDVPFVKLLDVVKVQPGFALAAQKLLSGVHVVESLEVAVKYFDQHPNSGSLTLVTQDGDIVTEYSFYSLRHEGGLIQLKNKELELDARVSELEALQEQAQTAREAAQQAVREAETFQAEALRRSRERQARVRELVNQRGTVIGRLQAERRTLEQVEQDAHKTQQQISDCQSKIQELHTEEARIVEELK